MSTNSEFSDCGYVTQLENKESISTSSNEEDDVRLKHFLQKNHIQKQRINIKKRPLITLQDRKDKRRKKLVDRGRTNMYA
jgi:timeless